MTSKFNREKNGETLSARRWHVCANLIRRKRMRGSVRKAMLLLLFPMIISISGAGAAGWLGFSSNGRSDSQFQVREDTWDHIRIDVSIPGVESREIATKGGMFSQLQLDDDAFKGAIGDPRIPVLRKIVEIPYGAEVTLGVETSTPEILGLAEAGLAYPLIPVQAPVPKLPGALEAAPFQINADTYSQNSFIGTERVRIQEIDTMRGHRLLVLEISPIAYNPSANAIQYVSQINIDLGLRNADQNRTLEMARRYADRTFDQIFNRIVLNHNSDRNFPFPPAAPISYLIISATDFQTALTPFIEWKENSGYDVTVETAPTGATTTVIKNIILNAYQNWENPPAYVLLAGDTNTIPCYTGEASGSADDNAYTELEGTGYWTPDIMIGRFPIRSVTDLENILAKVFQFEQMTMPSKDYFKDSVWLASSDHSSMIEATHHWCFDYHVEPIDPSSNTAHDVFERLGGDTADFAQNVNEGRGIVTYSGHGYGDGSGTASVHFVHENVNQLTNVDKYGHVNVFACGTNLHDQTISFGERWLLQPNKGSVSYWGTSESSYWDEDDAEQREVYRCQHEDLIHTLSAMYFTGLIAVYTSGGDSDYYFDIYNLMGDPSSDYVTRIPQSITINSADATTPNEQDFAVNVQVGGSGSEGALVAIRMNGQLLGAAYTDGNGDANVHIVPPEPGFGTILVSGHNLIPEEKPLMIMAAGCGAVALDRTMYNCDQTILMRLWDSDLNTNPGTINNALVDIASDSESTPESVILLETGPDTGEFTGTIQTSGSSSAIGFLLLAHGDAITLHYHDAACEGSPADVYDMASADCQGPIISGLTVSDLGVDTVTVSWTTDEASNTVLTWGISTPPGTVTTVPAMVTDHSITLDELQTCTEYFFKVESVDAGGNVAVDDNGGTYYSFTTLQLMQMLSANMDVNPGWTFQGQWAWGQPTGSSGDPMGGYTGNNVVGYNLSGSYGNSMTPTYATTPPFDCSGASQAYLSFWKWLGVESASYDHATVEISTNGSTWAVVWEHTGGSVEPSSWEFVEYDISSWAAGQSSVQVRWGMGPSDGSVVYCGWNIDDVSVSYTTPCNVPVLSYHSHEIDDSAGNNDGEINAGESIQMNVMLQNLGVDATGISATLSTTNPHVTITSDAANYPNIPQSGTGNSITPFAFDVSPEAADGETIMFSLSYICNGSTTGTTGVSDMVVAPSLVFQTAMVIDPERGDGDGILDPGETAQIVVTLSNVGNGNAAGVSAELTSDQPSYVTISDAVADYPDIPGSAIGQSLSPHYTVQISASIPDPTMVTFTLDISADGYSSSDTFTQDITSSTFARRYIWNMDSNPGWTAEPNWAWGDPAGTGGDPQNGFTGTNVYGYNLNGTYENNMTEKHLTTTAIDCSYIADAEVRFYRWLGVESASYDHASFKISTNGSTWTTLWDHTGSTLNETAWTQQAFDISSYADGQPMVYLRWTMGTSDSSLVYSGWNIDDVEIWGSAGTPVDTPTPAPPTNTPTITPTRTPTVPFTPTPTRTPTVPFTATPTRTPTVPPTATYTAAPTTPPTMTPTLPPQPTDTPTGPTATPTEGPTTLTVDLTLSQTMFHGGDQFLLMRKVINPGPELTLDEWIILDVYSNYWFYPTWTQEPQCVLTTCPAYDEAEMNVFDFEWPTVEGSANDLKFWAAMLDPSTSTLVGNYDMVSFGYE